VPRSPSVTGSEVTGVAATVLGVADLNAAVERFQLVFDLPRPETQSSAAFGAHIAGFPGHALILATPATEGNWLAERLSSYGTLPCGFLFHTDDILTTAHRLGADMSMEWFGRTVTWMELGGEIGGRIGAMES